mmetsp:Transcript_67435/g.188161  ORF Transcript_67435/g.188161 Transcript_67435/m.188161 type:complete len:293 (-) Transcript_67435:436-1314(-)
MAIRIWCGPGAATIGTRGEAGVDGAADEAPDGPARVDGVLDPRARASRSSVRIVRTSSTSWRASSSIKVCSCWISSWSSSRLPFSRATCFRCSSGPEFPGEPSAGPSCTWRRHARRLSGTSAGFGTLIFRRLSGATVDARRASRSFSRSASSSAKQTLCKLSSSARFAASPGSGARRPEGRRGDLSWSWASGATSAAPTPTQPCRARMDNRRIGAGAAGRRTVVTDACGGAAGGTRGPASLVSRAKPSRPGTTLKPDAGGAASGSKAAHERAWRSSASSAAHRADTCVGICL